MCLAPFQYHSTLCQEGEKLSEYCTLHLPTAGIKPRSLAHQASALPIGPLILGFNFLVMLDQFQNLILLPSTQRFHRLKDAASLITNPGFSLLQMIRLR